MTSNQALYFRSSALGKLLLQPPERRLTAGGHTLTGDIRTHRLSSVYLEDTVEVYVYLPPSFSASDPWRYPVLYLHDGQNVFDESTAAFGVEWGLDETAERLIAEREIEPLLIVAVSNTPERISLYTPFRDRHHGGGEGARYRSFLVEELKPFIDRSYPTKAGARSTALAGSSLGGLSALYIGWTRPGVFGMVAALSPSLWWGERSLITRIGGDLKAKGPQRIWLDMGDEESLTDDNDNGVPDVIDDLRTLRAVLVYHGYKEGQDLFYTEVAGGRHEEAAWAGRAESVLRALFPLSALS